MIKTFIINLPRDVERLKSVLFECMKEEIKPEVISAIDCKDIESKIDSDVWYKENVIQSDRTILKLKLNRKSVMTDKLSYGEIGCAMSHLKIYKKILDSDLDSALILEDDIKLESGFRQLVEKISKLKINSWDIVLIDYLSGIRKLSFETLGNIMIDDKTILYREGLGLLDPIINRRRIAFRTSCYMINRKASERLLQLGFPIRLPSDYLLGYPALHGLKLFTVKAEKAYASCKNDKFSSSILDHPKHKLK